MLHVQRETAETRSELEAGEGKLVGNDGSKTGQCHPERVMVEHRDPKQGQGEKNEIDRDAYEIQRLGRCRR